MVQRRLTSIPRAKHVAGGAEPIAALVQCCEMLAEGLLGRRVFRRISITVLPVRQRVIHERCEAHGYFFAKAISTPEAHNPERNGWESAASTRFQACQSDFDKGIFQKIGEASR